MKSEQNRKHRNKIRLWSLSFTVIILLLVSSVAYADGSSSVITLITASSLYQDQFGNPMASNGNATYSSVSSDGLKLAFDSRAKDLNESKLDTSYADIFLSVDDGSGNKVIHRIAGSETVDSACDQASDRCNSGFPVISHSSQAGNDPDQSATYDIVFSSSADLVGDNLNGSCGMFGFNCKSIYLAKVDLADPLHLKTNIKRVSVGTSNAAENGNSGYQDLSLITPINVLHPVAGVYECQVTLADECPLVPGNSKIDANHAKAGDAVVVFESDASNLVSGDSNHHKDIFLRDMGDPNAVPPVLPGAAVRVTTSTGGDSSNPVITDDGKYVAFVSTAPNIVTGVTTTVPQVYLLDIASKTFYLVSRDQAHNKPGDGESRYPSIIDNDNGKGGKVVEVAFHSTSTNLSAVGNNGIANIYVFSIDTSDPLNTQTLDLVSRGSSGGQGNTGPIGDMDSLTPYLSSGGGAVTFSSYADNLVEGANNYDCPAITLHGQQVTKCKDIYVSDLSAHQTWRVSLTSAGEQAQSNSAFPSLSGNGRLVSFTSYVDIFGTGGQDYHMQIYQRDQGVPLGNPNIQPSSWNFYAQANQTSSRTFTVTSLSFTTYLQSLDYGNPKYPGATYSGLTLGGKDPGSFTLDKGDCTDNLNLTTGHSCTFKVSFKATDMGGKSAILYVPINDDREAVAISLQGKTIVSYLPFFQLY